MALEIRSMTERENLIEELKKLHKSIQTSDKAPYEDLAEFILTDRKRIVEPLVKWETKEANTARQQDINETIKRAGIAV